MRQASPNRQQGATLLVGLIMLVLMTLMAVASFNLGRSNLIVVGNMQHRQEVVETAKAAVEEVISSANFTVSPTTALGAANNTKSYDTNGDGNSDVSVALTPAPCIKVAKVIKVSELDVTNSNDQPCILGVAQNLGMAGASSQDSLCADTVWEIKAVATNAATQASASVVQGLAVRVAADSGINSAYYCP